MFLHSGVCNDACFGEEDDLSPVTLDNVRCEGDEDRLKDCPARIDYYNYCDEAEAGVECQSSKYLGKEGPAW